MNVCISLSCNGVQNQLWADYTLPRRWLFWFCKVTWLLLLIIVYSNSKIIWHYLLQIKRFRSVPMYLPLNICSVRPSRPINGGGRPGWNVDHPSRWLWLGLMSLDPPIVLQGILLHLTEIVEVSSSSKVLVPLFEPKVFLKSIWYSFSYTYSLLPDPC